jgi:hypothetical protein
MENKLNVLIMRTQDFLEEHSHLHAGLLKRVYSLRSMIKSPVSEGSPSIALLLLMLLQQFPRVSASAQLPQLWLIVALASWSIALSTSRATAQHSHYAEAEAVLRVQGEQ